MSGASGSAPHLRFRDKVAARFRRTGGSASPLSSTSSLQPSSAVVAQALPVPSPAVAASAPLTTSLPYASTSPSCPLLEDALKRLPDRDQSILRAYIPNTTIDIDKALRLTFNAAEEKQRQCAEKRWTFTWAGRRVILKEEADKVVRWLNRFTTVGDAVANIDPVHIGLPWAGIHLLLEVRGTITAHARNLSLMIEDCCIRGEPNVLTAPWVRNHPLHDQSTQGVPGFSRSCSRDPRKIES